MRKLIFGSIFALVASLLFFQESTRFKFRTGVSADTLQSYTSSLYPTVNDSLGIVGRVMKYNNIATEGYGVPAMVDYVFLDSQTDSSGATNMTSTASTGTYRISMFLECYTVASGTATLKGKIFWKASNGSTTVEDSTSTITLTALGVNTHKVFVIRHYGADANYIQFNTIHDNAAADGYHGWIIAERLN